MHNYSFNIAWSPEDEAFIATCPEFPGLSAFGDTQEEALDEAEIALSLFIAEYDDRGRELPAPKSKSEYSGQTRLRMPPWLHESLAVEAERQNVSLNTLTLTYLSRCIGEANVQNQVSEALSGALNKLDSKLAKLYSLSEEPSDTQVQDPVLREIYSDAGMYSSDAEEANSYS